MVKNWRPQIFFWSFLAFTSVVYENLLSAVKKVGYKNRFHSIISNPKDFFLCVYLYWPACRHDRKNNTHKKTHKVSRHVQSTKMLIKSNKMFVDFFDIHTCKCKNIRVYLSSYCALRNWLFLHTYASSKKTLHCSEVESKAVLNLHFFPNFHSCKCFVKKMIPWIQCRTRKGETKSKFGKKKFWKKKSSSKCTP